MQLTPKTNCPLNNFDPCKEMDCAWFTKVSGKNPQIDKEIDEWGCAVAWLPVMLVENARVGFQTGAAVESFRNEMIRVNETTAQMLLSVASQRSSDLKIIEVK